MRGWDRATAHGGLYNTDIARDTASLGDYDAANRLLAERQTIGAGAKTVGYSYTADSLADTTSYPGGARMQQTYTARRQLHEVKLSPNANDPLVAQATHSYDTASRLTQRDFANGTRVAWTYDANSRVTALTHTKLATNVVFQDFGYLYTDEGDPLAQVDNTPGNAVYGEAYRYDMMHRLTSYKRGIVDVQNQDVANPTFTGGWGLDKVGNWSNWDNNGTAETRTHSNMHALNTRTIGQAPAKTLAYDANGSQTYDGEKFGFEYDANDQLKVVFVDDGTNGGTAGDGLRNGGEPIVSAYRYDVMGRRVEKNVSAGYPEGALASTTRFYYSGQRIIEERNGEQGENEKVLAFYTYGNYIDEPLTMDRFVPPPPGEGQGEGAFVRYYFHHNRMFSTYALTDSTGAVAERYSYEAYGKVTTYAADYSAPQSASRLGNPFTFTGRELDPETGLMHYRARTYDPVEGRFKQTDPVGADGGLNVYAFAHDNPMLSGDPSGEIAERFMPPYENPEPFQTATLTHHGLLRPGIPGPSRVDVPGQRPHQELPFGTPVVYYDYMSFQFWLSSLEGESCLENLRVAAWFGMHAPYNRDAVRLVAENGFPVEPFNANRAISLEPFNPMRDGRTSPGVHNLWGGAMTFFPVQAGWNELRVALHGGFMRGIWSNKETLQKLKTGTYREVIPFHAIILDKRSNVVLQDYAGAMTLGGIEITPEMLARPNLGGDWVMPDRGMFVESAQVDVLPSAL